MAEKDNHGLALKCAELALKDAEKRRAEAEARKFELQHKLFLAVSEAYHCTEAVVAAREALKDAHNKAHQARLHVEPTDPYSNL